MDYIIVQAGGKGTRLQHLTTNKPKTLVPVENLPMLFHFFRKFPDKHFIIIVDYKKDVLKEYLECFANVKYQVVDAAGTGTCSGVRDAAAHVPENEPFMLVWSDLILPEKFEIPDIDKNFVGISENFVCRWSYQNNEFVEQSSAEYGVAGLFLFKDKSYVKDIPLSGELVRYFKTSGAAFSPLSLAGTREFGTLAEYYKLECDKTRPFNSIAFKNGVVTKTALDEQGKKLAKLEAQWYSFALENGITAIPNIYSVDPLKMEQIVGRNVYDMGALEHGEKLELLQKMVAVLKDVHSAYTTMSDTFSSNEAYYIKTIGRLSKVRDLIPFADRETIVVNGRICRNVYFHKRELEDLIKKIKCNTFSFIHGDCTFSNIMVRENGEPVLLDPRGYFGHTELIGDTNYDWAKLYYSIVGNYDRFNLKDFSLNIDTDSVQLTLESNSWEDMEQEFFSLTGADKNTIKLIHAIIWLSLTTYTWQNYDSICGAFYNGIYYLEELLP